jgi:hypothetical protein
MTSQIAWLKLLKLFLSLVVIVLAIAGLSYNNNAYAHDFDSDESSSFLALIESIKVELDLARINLVSNSTISTEHAMHAHEHLDDHAIEEIAERNERLGRDLPAALEELHVSIGNSSATEVEARIQSINDLLDETLSVRIDREQLTNSTIQAVFVATLVDGALEHYNKAYGLGSNESGHAGNETHDSRDSEESGMSMNETYSMAGNETDVTQSETITDIVSYQTAQGLADRALEIFNGTVKDLAPANSTEALVAIEAGLLGLNQSIADKTSPNEIELIVHGEIHPGLQRAYDLQVIPEFPVSLLVAIGSVAGVIIAGRFKMLHRS